MFFVDRFRINENLEIQIFKESCENFESVKNSIENEEEIVKWIMHDWSFRGNVFINLLTNAESIDC